MKNIILIALGCTALMGQGATLNLSSASLNLTGTSTSSATPSDALSVQGKNQWECAGDRHLLNRGQCQKD